MLYDTIQLELVKDGVEFRYNNRVYRRIMKVGLASVWCELIGRSPSEPQYTDLPEKCDVVVTKACHPRLPLTVPLSTVPDSVMFTIDGIRHQRIRDVGYGMILCQVIDNANHVFRQVTIRSELEVILEADIKLNPQDDSHRLPSRPRSMPPLTESQPSDHPVQIAMAGGKAASSVGPPFHLIPTSALTHLANRFQKGIERKGDKAWNALSKNQECLTDKDFVIERMSHIIHHALKLRDQIRFGVQPGDESLTENAAAMAWGGIFAICAAEQFEKS
jgi:hypothetical protein